MGATSRYPNESSRLELSALPVTGALVRGLSNSSTTQFTLELGAGCCVRASSWSQWTTSRSLRAFANSTPVCAACWLPER